MKKLLIADRLRPVGRPPVLRSRPPSAWSPAWAAALGYALQLYFDFSGYSDMAVGLGLAARLPVPAELQLAVQGQDASPTSGRRWHMTLSRWLRDYLFFSLARRFATGSSRRAGRRERLGTYLCLFLTMAIAGLWHGAAWTFVVWGALMGLALASERAYRDYRRLKARPARVQTAARKAMHRAATFAFVVAAFVVFRSPSLAAAGDVLSSMLGLNGVESLSQVQELLTGRFVALLVILLVFVNTAPNTWQIELVPRIRYGLALGLASALAIMSIAALQTFIYFQF